MKFVVGAARRIRFIDPDVFSKVPSRFFTHEQPGKIPCTGPTCEWCEILEKNRQELLDRARTVE